MKDVVAFNADGESVAPDAEDMAYGEYTDEHGVRNYFAKVPTVVVNRADDNDPVNTELMSGPTEWDGPATYEALLSEMGADTLTDGALRTRMGNLLLLPSWPNAPESLRKSVTAYLAS